PRRHVIEPHEIAPLALHVADRPIRHRLERPAEAPPALPRVLRHAAFLPAVARQKHHDPIRLTERVSPQNQGVGGVVRHPGAGSNYTLATLKAVISCSPA